MKFPDRKRENRLRVTRSLKGEHQNIKIKMARKVLKLIDRPDKT
jgi:hypothetical protein